MTATYTKLKDGTWGVRVAFSGKGSITAGDTVEVKKKSGEKKTETITKVLWSGNGVYLCAIKTSIAVAGSGKTCAECGGPGGTIPCRDSSGISGMCCRSCANGPDHGRSFA